MYEYRGNSKDCRDTGVCFAHFVMSCVEKNQQNAHSLTNTQSPTPTPPPKSHSLLTTHFHTCSPLSHTVTENQSFPPTTHTLTNTQSPSPTPSRVTVFDRSVSTSDAAWGFPLVATVIGTFHSISSKPVSNETDNASLPGD